MPQSCRPSDEEIINAYERLGSCRAAGEELKIAPQTVHKRLCRSGHGAKPINVLTENEKAAITKYYAETPALEFDLKQLAAQIGRSRNSVQICASRMGLGKRGRSHTTAARKMIGEKNADSIRRNGHPRGMLGKKHTEEFKAWLGQETAKKWATDKAFGSGWMSEGARDRRRIASASLRARDPQSTKSHTRAAGGRSEDLGDTWFRSSWERNYARYLNQLVKLRVVEWWDYEKEVFWFEGVKRGCVSYRPDFRVKYRNVERVEYVEIKGWVTAKDKTKWKRMKKYHPSINLVVIAQKEYREIANRWASSLLGWETGKRPPAAFTLAFGKQVEFSK